MKRVFQKYSYYLLSSFELLLYFKPILSILQVFLRRTQPGHRQVILRKSGLAFFVRGIMDIWSIKETFIDRMYERYGAPIGKNWKIMDIGGGIGDFTIFAARRAPGNQVAAFEPTPDSYHWMQINLDQNQIKNVLTYNEAIWSHHGQLEIDTTQGEPGQFISQAVDISSSKPGKVIVPSITLVEAFSRLAWQTCDLLKIDAEGAEYAILFNAPDEVFARIQRIVMEYHDQVTTFSHQDLARFLESKGYQVTVNINVVHEDLGYLYACKRQDR